jgi:ubiquinone/menaquinone biosynthesis C-methylase UbiE
VLNRTTEPESVPPPFRREAGDANDPLLTFQWPRIPGSVYQPIWSGQAFLDGNREIQFLNYTEAVSAWSDELTAMHEAEAASSHPIDVASRRLALESMRALKGRPVILDIGCSSGFLLQDLHSALPNAALIGADYLSSLLNRAALNVPCVPLLQFDLRTCPLHNESVDGVTALNVLEHIDDDEEALRQMHRILRRGGIAHVEIPSCPSCYDVYDEVLMHYRRYKLPQLRAMCEQIGFAVEWANHLGFFFFPLFWVIKQTNRVLAKSWTGEYKRRVVARQIRKTARRKIMSPFFSFERISGNAVHYPVGIRAVLRLRKV